jgi:hypothetical protein
MALTLQRKLELAGDLSKVQPLLQRLHIVAKPKQRHPVRNLVLIGGAIAAGAVVAVVVGRRCGCCNDALTGREGEVGSGAQDTPETAPDSEGPAARADGPQGIGASGPA